MYKNPVVTLLCSPSNPDLEAHWVEQIAQEICAQKIDWLAKGEAVDLYLPPNNDNANMAELITKRIGTKKIDFAIQEAANRRKKALIADMDSTMINQECIDELAAEIGVKDHVAQITARAMNGEIDFEPALRERVSLLKGLPLSIADTVMENRITFADGAKTLLATMRANGARCALVSGGFTLFTQKVADTLGFHEHLANILESTQNELTGKVREPILGSQAKVLALNEIALHQSLSHDDFIAVGDGANDLPMLMTAGTGIALHAKPSVAQKARIAINHGDLTSLLYLQGYHKEEFVIP